MRYVAGILMFCFVLGSGESSAAIALPFPCRYLTSRSFEEVPYVFAQQYFDIDTTFGSALPL